MTNNLSRKALYDLVWSKPMIAVAKDYGLSDRGLAKLCERHSIPVPPRGYWAKKEAGQKVLKAPLIILESNEPDTIILLKRAKPTIETSTHIKEKKILPEAIQEAINRERLIENQIKVPSTLHNPHPIIDGWVKAEKRETEFSKKYGTISWRTPTTPLTRRKWKIANCLFKQLAARGFQVTEENYRGYPTKLWIKYSDDKILFDIDERIKQYRRALTPEEKAARSYDQKWTQVREQTGKLEIILILGDHNYLKTKIHEDDRPFEDNLNEVVIKIIEVMWQSKCARLKKEERDQQYRKEEDDRYARKLAAENEKKKESNLEFKAFSWKRAQTIRDYIQAVESAKDRGQLQIDDVEFIEWKAWSMTYADQIDFIINGNPLIKLSGAPENLTNYSVEERHSDSLCNSSSGHPWRSWYNW